MTLMFSVIDEGGGIPADALERLFEPFFSTKTEGMGMGLNICRSIVELHQGRLWVESNTAAGSGGSIFRFTLGASLHDEHLAQGKHAHARKEMQT